MLTGTALSGFPNLSVGERVVSLSEPAVRFGVVTDVHYADKAKSGSRYYRESMWKMQEAIQRFNVSGLDFIVELGDFVDSAPDLQGEIHHLHAIDAEFAKFNGERHYVIGNHCVSTFTKPQFIENCGAREPYYSFDVGEFHFVVLDACFRYDEVAYASGNFTWTECEIPSFERDWLREDLAATNHPTVCFIHQRIDTPPDHGIKSYRLLREMLEEPQKVMAVFQGHSHTNYMRDSRRRQTNGFREIYYLTLQAMVNGTGEAHCGYPRF